MKTQNAYLPIEAIVNLLNAVDAKAKEKIFEEVFIGCDTNPLSREEKESVELAMNDFRKGETVSWTISK